eukprot:15449683-Alexandrium_andersonii.AAC.1
MCRMRWGRPGRVRRAPLCARACGVARLRSVSSSGARRARACGLGRPAGWRGTLASARRPCGRIDVAGVCLFFVFVDCAQCPPLVSGERYERAVCTGADCA